MTIRWGLSVFLLGFLLCGSAWAQSPRTEHTFQLDDPANQPSATLKEVAWLVGDWVGSAFGAQIEEVWNPPSAGSMVGLFKVIRDEQVSFYEIMLLVEEGDSLNLKVKHFNADFSAWEEKTEHVTFPLVAIEQDAIHFSGLSFYRNGPDEFVGYVAMRYGDEVREEVLEYRRRGAD
jgi:hypothetical protein